MNRKKRTQQEQATEQDQTTKQPQTTEPDQQPSASPEDQWGCLLRVYWMVLGNGLLAIAVCKILQAAGQLTSIDVVYWVLVVSLVAVRYVDIRFLHGRTGEGHPATMKDWRRYSFRVLAIASTLWCVAHGVSYFWQ